MLVLIAPNVNADALAESRCASFTQIVTTNYVVLPGLTVVLPTDTTIRAQTISIQGTLLTAPHSSGRGSDLCLRTERLEIGPSGSVGTAPGAPGMAAIGQLAQGTPGLRGGDLLILIDEDVATPSTSSIVGWVGSTLRTGGGGDGGPAIGTIVDFSVEPLCSEPSVNGRVDAGGGNGGNGGILDLFTDQGTTVTIPPLSILMGSGGDGGSALAYGENTGSATATGGDGGLSLPRFNGAKFGTAQANWVGASTGGDGGNAIAENIQCLLGPTYEVCSAMTIAQASSMSLYASPPFATPSGGADAIYATFTAACEGPFDLYGADGNGKPDEGGPGNNGLPGQRGDDGRGDRWASASAALDGGGAACLGPRDATGGQSSTVPATSGGDADGTAGDGNWGFMKGGNGGSTKAAAGQGGAGGKGGDGGNGDGGAVFPCNADARPGAAADGAGGAANGVSSAIAGSGGGSFWAGGNGGSATATTAAEGAGGAGGNGGKGNDYPDGQLGCGGPRGSYVQPTATKGNRGEADVGTDGTDGAEAAFGPDVHPTERGPPGAFGSAKTC